MKTKLANNGDLIISTGINALWVVLGIAIFLYLGKSAFLFVFTAENVQGGRTLAIVLIMLTVLFFYRVFSLSSLFKFCRSEYQLEYQVEHIFSNDKGTVPLNFIDLAMVERGDDGAGRVLIVCHDRKIPLTTTVQSSSALQDVANKINQWLGDNKIKD